MIHLTGGAAAKLKELGDSDAPVLRLSIKGRTCCGFRYGLRFVNADEIDASSTVSEADGVRLLTDPATTAACQGFEVDYVETAECVGFTVRNPDAPAGCTCGGGAPS
jgi:iron-sulfur cluster assembly accessory protein